MDVSATQKEPYTVRKLFVNWSGVTHQILRRSQSRAAVASGAETGAATSDQAYSCLRISIHFARIYLDLSRSYPTAGDILL